MTLRGDLAEVAVRAFTGAGSDVLGPLFSNAAAYSDALQRDQLSPCRAQCRHRHHRRPRRADRRPRQPNAPISPTSASRPRRSPRPSPRPRRRRSSCTAEYQARNAPRPRSQARRPDRRGRGPPGRRGRSPVRPRGRRRAGQRRCRGHCRRYIQRRWIGRRRRRWKRRLRRRSTGGGGAAVVAVAALHRHRPGPATSRHRRRRRTGQLPGAVVARRHRDHRRAIGQLGVPYVAYQSIPGVAFDCSGLTSLRLGPGRRVPAAPVACPGGDPCRTCPPARPKPGDLIFYYTPISHVGIYLGGGSLIHAPNTGRRRQGRTRSTGTRSSASADPADPVARRALRYRRRPCRDPATASTSSGCRPGSPTTSTEPWRRSRSR